MAEQKPCICPGQEIHTIGTPAVVPTITKQSKHHCIGELTPTEYRQDMTPNLDPFNNLVTGNPLVDSHRMQRTENFKRLSPGYPVIQP